MVTLIIALIIRIDLKISKVNVRVYFGTYTFGESWGPGGGGGTWVNFFWVYAAGFSDPLPHYSLFCGQL